MSHENLLMQRAQARGITISKAGAKKIAQVWEAYNEKKRLGKLSKASQHSMALHALIEVYQRYNLPLEVNGLKSKVDSLLSIYFKRVHSQPATGKPTDWVDISPLEAIRLIQAMEYDASYISKRFPLAMSVLERAFSDRPQILAEALNI